VATIRVSGSKNIVVSNRYAIAGVSRRTFDERFADLEGCFLAACERARQALFGAAD
jgi:hypothetical protein